MSGIRPRPATSTSRVRTAPGDGDRAALVARFAAAHLDWIVPDWAAPPSVHAFFTTRNGDAGTPAQPGFDLGGTKTVADPRLREAIASNRRRVQEFLPSPPVWLDQVHGTDVVVVEASHDALRAARADAAVTRAADTVLAVRVADCLPVLLCDRGGSVVGAAHAGWRGLAAGVLERTVAAMTCEPAELLAWIGPAIGAQAFEVGAEVRAAFMHADPAAAPAFVPGKPQKWHADLVALARRRLSRAGVDRVAGGDLCTVSDPSRFHSFRRDGTAARMAAFIWRNVA